MAYQITYTNTFKKEYQRCKKRGYDMSLLRQAITMLSETGTLPPKYKPHKLTGNYKDCWECHLRPDWLLVWKQNDKKLILLFTTIPAHMQICFKLPHSTPGAAGVLFQLAPLERIV